METVLESSSNTVVIGPDRPFCVIGERINPTGRKKFQAELQNGRSWPMTTVLDGDRRVVCMALLN